MIKLLDDGIENRDGTVYAWSETQGRHVAQQGPRLRNPPIPVRARAAMLGSSTTANSESVVLGTDTPSARSIIFEVAEACNFAWDINCWGYTSQTNATILSHLPEVYAWNPDVILLQLSANDFSANTEAAAETAFATLQAAAIDVISRGIAVVIETPHYNGSNWRAALHYDTLCQEWGAYMGIPVLSGPDCIAAKTDKIGTAPAGWMADSLHVSDLGARLGYGVGGRRLFVDNAVRSILSGGSAQVLSELFANPRMGGSQAVADSGFTGTKPLDWSIARSGTGVTGSSSVGSDAEGPHWDLSITNSASDEYVTISDASVAATLAARVGLVLRHLVDVEIVTPGLVENVRAYFPFSAGTIQTPNGNSGNYSGTMQARRRFISSVPINTAVFGAALAASPGARVSFSGAGTTVLRFRGCGARESRW